MIHEEQLRKALQRMRDRYTGWLVEALRDRLWNEGDEVDALLAEKLRAVLADPTDGKASG